jgi:phage shock protein A
MGSAPPSFTSSTDNPVWLEPHEDSFEALTFTSDNLDRYIRKLKEEITELKTELATEKKHKEIFEREVKVCELHWEKMELETKLQQVPQSGAQKSLEKSGKMEQKFGEMKEELKKELKEEMQKLTSVVKESKEKLASVTKKMEQISNEIKSMMSKLSEIHD